MEEKITLTITVAEAEALADCIHAFFNYVEDTGVDPDDEAVIDLLKSDTLIELNDTICAELKRARIRTSSRPE